MLKIKHNCGFFSCCSVKLDNIVSYVNSEHVLPEQVDSSEQFKWYKPDANKDITYDYFEHYDNVNIKVQHPIDFKEHYQYFNYSKLHYTSILPLVQKYFSPSLVIQSTIRTIEQKYNLIYENTCVLFYRGNDKNRETNICGYHEYLKYANEIIKHQPNILFLIQSDETEFIEFITEHLPHHSFYFKDEIRHMKKCNNTVDKTMTENIEQYSKNYLAITIVMSKCKYIICGSGNCSIWIMFYRGNIKNVIQNLNGQWYKHGFDLTTPMTT